VAFIRETPVRDVDVKTDDDVWLIDSTTVWDAPEPSR